MALHWESSKRPLFIKTVWKDGQHHVLLNKEELSIKARRYISPRFSKNSSRCCKSATSSSVSNMKVSSFKLLECGNNIESVNKLKLNCNNYDDGAFNDKTCFTTSSVKRHQSAPPIKKLNLSFKYKSIDLADVASPAIKCNEEIKCIDASPLSVNNTDLNSLSQRVLVWLDLALQNNDIDKNIKPLTDRLSGVPNGLTTQKKVKTFKTRKSACIYMKENHSSFDELTDTFHVGRVPELIKTVGSLLPKNTIPENCYNSVSSIYSDAQPIVSSVIEAGMEIPKIADENNSEKVVSLKRQVHIFMPNLQNKTDDCESSILSSNYSSYSSKKYSVFCV